MIFGTDGFTDRMTFLMFGMCMELSAGSFCSMNLKRRRGHISSYVGLGSYLAIHPQIMIFSRRAV